MSSVDLLSTLSDVQMTFMNEIDGKACRVQMTNVYTSKENKNEGIPNNDRNRLPLSRSKILMKFNEIFETKEQEERKKIKNLPE